MLHSPPASISLYDGRREALKTSWVNTVYPDLPDPQPKLDVPFFTSADVDPNGLIGLNPDGTWDLPVLYDWTSWKIPTIKDLRIMQYAFLAGNVRITWEASGGDVFRTGYLVERSTESDFSSSVTIVAVFRFGPEFNPTDSSRFTKYAKQGKGVVAIRPDEVAGAGGAVDYLDVTKWGTMATATTEVEPDATAFYDDFDENRPTVVFAALDPDVSGNSSGAGPYYYRIRMVDGREFHTLPNSDPVSSYGTSSNPDDDSYGVITEAEEATVFYADNDMFNHTPDGEGVLLFNRWGTWSEYTIGYTSAEFTPANSFPTYLGNGLVWVGVEEGDNSSASFPPAGLNWQALSAPHVIITDLDNDTTYTAWIYPYVEGDVDEPSTGPGETGPQAVFTTESTQLSAPTIQDLNDVSPPTITFNMNFSTVSGADAYSFYWRDSGPGRWNFLEEVQDDGNSEMWHQATLPFNAFYPVDIGIRATGAGGGDSDIVYQTINQ